MTCDLDAPRGRSDWAYRKLLTAHLEGPFPVLVFQVRDCKVERGTVYDQAGSDGSGILRR